MSEDPQLPDREWTVDSIVSDRLSATIGPLEPNITYFFKIQARNNIGYGPHSDILHYRVGQKVAARHPLMPGSVVTDPTPPSFTGKCTNIWYSLCTTPRSTALMSRSSEDVRYFNCVDAIQVSLILCHGSHDFAISKLQTTSLSTCRAYFSLLGNQSASNILYLLVTSS